MPNLQYLEAEFHHLCKLFDMFPATKLAEVVTLYILGNDAQYLSYRNAHQRAVEIGLEGVTLLHSSPKLYEKLQQGLKTTRS